MVASPLNDVLGHPFNFKVSEMFGHANGGGPTSPDRIIHSDDYESQTDVDEENLTHGSRRHIG